MAMLKLALHSLWNRRTTALLTIITIAISVCLLLGVEKVRNDARTSFANTIAGTDLIIGARSGSVQLLLYSVFRIGNASNNVSWQSYQHFSEHRSVAWTIPLSLGDSHRGYRVLGTNHNYFKHYQFGNEQALGFKQGQAFEDIFEAVIGAEVAEALNYKVGQEIIINHGLGNVGITQHKDKPFVVSGILQRTGTPVDQTVHVSLQGIEAIHIGWQNGMPSRNLNISADQLRQIELQPKSITAFMVGLKSKLGIFRVQRDVNDYRAEPLLAVLPGVALQELWSLMSVAEQALLIIAVFVVISGLIGMLTMILASLNERRREMAILRALGARPTHIFSLLISEAGLLASLGAALGLTLFYGLLLIAQPMLEGQFGIHLQISMLTPYDLTLLGLIIGAGFVVGLIPALRAYRHSLADGMTIRI